VELHQDTTALRSRTGDTGSVLWQASVDLARLLLKQYQEKQSDLDFKSLLNYQELTQSHVLELGAGTGLLPILLTPLVRCYTVTDIEAELQLIRKNLTHNLSSWEREGKISVEPCDWLQLHSMPAHSRTRYFTTDSAVDLILVVDCIFNPALIAPLVSSLVHYATPNKTLVMVMMELRSHEVVQEFLSAWLSSATWEIWRVCGSLLHSRYALWVGCKQN